MATYTITTNARQEAGLTYVTQLENERRAARIPPLPPLTNDEMLRQILSSAFKSFVKDYWMPEIVKIKAATEEKWDDLTQQDRDSIKIKLGV